MVALQKGNMRKAKSKDLLILAELVCQLWPDHTGRKRRWGQFWHGWAIPMSGNSAVSSIGPTRWNKW